MQQTLRPALLAACLVPAIVCAGETAPPDKDEDIVVYGTRLGQSVTEAGSSISVITAEDIEALGVDFVADAIALAPGVTVNQNGSYGGVSTVRIRGASSEHTLVLIDGVATNDPSSPGGGYNFASLDPSNVERIEILKGPQSTLWGTDAIGGVVNIVTRRPTERLAGRVFAEGGSFGTARAGAEISGAGALADYRLAWTRHSSDGISKADEINGNAEEDGYVADSVNARGGFALPGEATVEVSMLWSDTEADFDSFLFGAQGNIADGNEMARTEELVADIKLQVPAFGGKLRNLFLAGYSEIDRENFIAGEPAYASGGDRHIYRYQGTLDVGDAQRLAFGAERETLESTDGKTTTDGLFALYEVSPIESTTISAGIRRDNHESFGAETTGRLAAAFSPSDQVTLHASWGQAFKAPTLFQTTYFCCGATSANTDLRPELSDAWDAGVTWRTRDGRAEADVTWFEQDYRDLITFSFEDGGYANVARARSTGVELSASVVLTRWLKASVGYSLIDTDDGNGQPLERVPEHAGNLRLGITPTERLSASLLVRYNGKEQDAAGTNADWVRVDLAGRYALGDAIQLFARIENLFDEHYQQVIGYGTPGRAAWAGAEFGF